MVVLISHEFERLRAPNGSWADTDEILPALQDLTTPWGPIYITCVDDRMIIEMPDDVDALDILAVYDAWVPTNPQHDTFPKLPR